MQPPKATDKIFSNLYAAFSHYPKPERVAGSPVSVNEGDDKPLLSKPLRSLTIADFGQYPFKAMSTWGTEADFKYFLPRILELSFSSFSLLTSTTFFTKILSAGWQDWNLEEKSAFEAYLLAMWDNATWLPGQNLQLIGVLAENLPYFIEDFDDLVREWAKKWVESDEERLFEQLVRYLDTNWIAVFYESKPHYAFLDVLLESTLKERLEKAFYHYEKSHPEFAAQISRCEQKFSYYISTH